MANFSKVLGLASTAFVFAGMAFGQGTCTAAAPATNIIRGEGTTELIAPIAFSCTAGGAGTISLQVFMSPALPITSKAISSTATEAVAVVSGAGAVLGPPPMTTFNGSVSGSTLSFTGIQVNGGAFTVTVSNVRVNATSVTVGTGVPPNISATAFASGSAGTIVPVALTFSNVAFVQNGLGTSSVSKSFTTAAAAAPAISGFPNGAAATSGANSFVVCNAYSPTIDTGVGLGAQKSLAFAVTVKENFPSAFKNAAGEASQVPVGAGTGNVVVDGTRIAVNFANVPSNVTLYVPVGLISTTQAQTAAGIAPLAAPPAAIQLTASAPGTAFAAVTASTASAVKGFGLAPVTVSGGTGTAVFEVINQDPNNFDIFNIPVYATSTANSVAGSSTAMTASVSFNPIGSTVIPNFAVGSSTTTLTGSTFSLCTTSLLFPFVTNQLGFDTGIAISNTSTDPFSTQGATAQTGTCTLNFYGSGAPSPANYVTPAAVASGTSWTTVLSSVAAGFQGYIIAQCGFQYAHGFAFITSGLGTANGIAEGYLAGVIPDTNQVARAAGVGEVLGN